jgi:ABC-type lipoprotein release transport system permease subunit
MILYLRLAWRNIWRHRRRTLIVVLSIGFTMAMMMLYDGLIAGFEQSIYSNAIKVLGGNIQIHADGYKAKADQNPLLPLDNEQAVLKAARSQPQVVAASRRITTGGMATNRVGSFAVSIVGIEPELELPISLVGQHVSAGRYLKADDQDVVFIGKGMAEAMNVQVGDRITLAGRATHQQMRTRTLTIVGIFDVGIPDVEKRTLYMSLAEAQNLYGLTGQVTEVMVSLQQLGQELSVMNALRPVLPGYELAAWDTNYPELQQAISAKSGVMDVFGVIILGIVGIGIFNLLLMAIYERTREIGVLGALGMKPGQISILFLLEGMMLGLVGVAFGVGLGLGCNLLLAQGGLDFSKYANLTQYMALITGKIYPTLGLEKLTQRVVTVIVITLLASLYPAQEAAQNEPAKSLHFV